MDPSFLESLPEAHPIEAARGATPVALELVLKEFFKAVSESTGAYSIALAAGVAYNQLEGLEA